MQLQMFEPEYLDLSEKRVLLGLSGGINSAALLCFLATQYPEQYRPAELHLYAIELEEHSPDTFQFTKACIRYAARHFSKIRWYIKWGSALRFFEDENMIPHPILSPCSEHLKIIPMLDYYERHNLDIDLIGYVRTERSRMMRQSRKSAIKYYPIAHLSNDDCFEIVDREIGWHPAIYDIRDPRTGKRVFNHNNCLPCQKGDGFLDDSGDSSGYYTNVEMYFPEYFEKARVTAEKTGSYWGRKQRDDNPDLGGCPICELL